VTDDWPVPTRTEPRGEFPPHDEILDARPPRTAEQAREYARARLQRWRAEQ